jgi:hypothetical protein
MGLMAIGFFSMFPQDKLVVTFVFHQIIGSKSG